MKDTQKFALGVLVIAGGLFLGYQYVNKGVDSSPLLPTPATPVGSRLELRVYTADWCEPCKRLKRDVLDSPRFKSEAAKHGLLVVFIDGTGKVAQVPTCRLVRVLGDGRELQLGKDLVGYHGPIPFVRWILAAAKG